MLRLIMILLFQCDLRTTTSQHTTIYTNNTQPSYELLSFITDHPGYYMFTHRTKLVPNDFVVIMQAVRIYNYKLFDLYFFPILSLEWKRANVECCNVSNVHKILMQYNNNTFCVSKWNNFDVKMYVTSETMNNCLDNIKMGKITTYYSFKGFLNNIKNRVAIVYYYVHNIENVGDKKPIELELVLINRVVKIIDEKENKIQYYISIFRHNTDEIWIVVNGDYNGINEIELEYIFKSTYWVIE